MCAFWVMALEKVIRLSTRHSFHNQCSVRVVQFSVQDVQGHVLRMWTGNSA